MRHPRFRAILWGLSHWVLVSISSGLFALWLFLIIVSRAISLPSQRIAYVVALLFLDTVQIAAPNLANLNPAFQSWGELNGRRLCLLSC